MARPRRLKIDGKTIKILWDQKIGTSQNRLSGKHDDGLIKISKGMRKKWEQSTLFHELLHYLWEKTQLHKFISRRVEETIVEWIASELFHTLRENPDLVEYLMEDA